MTPEQAKARQVALDYAATRQRESDDKQVFSSKEPQKPSIELDSILGPRDIIDSVKRAFKRFAD
jgi:hypothetical protein